MNFKARCARCHGSITTAAIHITPTAIVFESSPCVNCSGLNEWPDDTRCAVCDTDMSGEEKIIYAICADCGSPK